jgi:mono/diheme cytochrome c family protein
VRTKHFVRGGLVGAWIAAAVVIGWAPRGGRGGRGEQLAATPRDTVRDSLLVSDSIYQGWKWWHVYCFRCHGEDAMHPILPTAPDLRWAVSPSGQNFPRDSFFNTAWNGRPTKGMPAWNVLLDSAAIKEVYLYVKARSDGWLKPGRPHRLSDLQQKTKSP